MTTFKVHLEGGDCFEVYEDDYEVIDGRLIFSTGTTTGAEFRNWLAVYRIKDKEKESEEPSQPRGWWLWKHPQTAASGN